MITPSITRIKILHLPMISMDTFDIMVNVVNYEVKRYKIIVQVLQKNYTLERNTVRVKLPIKTPTYTHPLQAQLKGNGSLRVKAFIYDTETEKIVEARLQEFGMPMPKPTFTASPTGKMADNENFPTVLEYKPNDDLLRTVPTIVGNWEVPKKEVASTKPRQIVKIEVSKGKSIDGITKEFTVDVLLDNLTPKNISLNQTVEIEIDKTKTIASYYPAKDKKENQLFAKVKVKFPTVVAESQMYDLNVRVVDNQVFGTPQGVNSKTIKVMVSRDGSVELVNESEVSNNFIDKKYFYKQYQVLFGSLTKQKVSSIELIIDSISEYYQSENRKCNKHQLAYILATVKHETDDTFNPINEYGGDKYYESMYDPILGKNEKRRNMALENGNTVKGDGVKYHGRGFVQLTWKNNYSRMSDKFKVDLLNNPEQALEPKLAIKILVNGSEEGTFTGLKLADFINSITIDFYNARKVINGLDKATKIKDYAIAFEKCIELK